MKTEIEEQRKKRIIRRFLTYSDIYEKNYLEVLPVIQLLLLQKRTFIELLVVVKYRNRHKSSGVKNAGLVN